MLYGNKKKDDKISSCPGQTGTEDSKTIVTGILPSFLSKAFYTASVVCNPGPETVSKNRLSWYYPDAKGLLRPTQSAGAREDTSLFNPLLCRKKAAKKGAFESLLTAIFRHAIRVKLIDTSPQGAVDSTGLETRYTSQHYIRCTRRSSFYRRKWPKWTVVCDTRTHLIAACIVSRGPSLDFPYLPKVMEEANRRMKFDQVLADAGYDSETNHYFCREVLGIRSTVIAYNRRRTRNRPTGKYRSQMACDFDKKAYNNRWQVESVFSRNKRLLGSSLCSRTESSRRRECLLRVLTHNLMIIRRAA